MDKTYKRSRKSTKNKSTRKRTGGFMNYLNEQVKKGKDMANKHYEDAKNAAAPHAERMMEKTSNSLNNMKDTSSSLYNKAKNSSVSNRVTFAVAEKYGKKAMDNGKTMGTSMMNKGNSMATSMMNKGNSMGTSMMNRFNPNGMKPKNIEQAVDGSVAGVPQSLQYPRAQLATKLPTTI